MIFLYILIITLFYDILGTVNATEEQGNENSKHFQWKTITSTKSN